MPSMPGVKPSLPRLASAGTGVAPEEVLDLGEESGRFRLGFLGGFLVELGSHQISLQRGLPVSGSDAKDSRVVTALRAEGARIAIGHDQMKQLGNARLMPGMPVEVFIRTGDRTVLSYLMKPLADQTRRAFREK